MAAATANILIIDIVMWPFTSYKSLSDSGLLKNSIDYHSHILPGVDDGVQILDDSLEILSNFEQQGVSELWLTPHIMEDIPNNTQALKLRFEELCTAYKGGIKLHLAAEYMLDSLFNERLQNNDILPIGETGNHILVETSYFASPMQLYETLARIKSKGYYPLLAHPERYQYMNEKDYKKLKAMDVKLQLNWASLAGRYGKPEQKKAEWLVKNDMYSVVGSDTHRLSMRHWEMKIDSSVLKRLSKSSANIKAGEWNL